MTLSALVSKQVFLATTPGRDVLQHNHVLFVRQLTGLLVQCPPSRLRKLLTHVFPISSAVNTFLGVKKKGATMIEHPLYDYIT